MSIQKINTNDIFIQQLIFLLDKSGIKKNRLAKEIGLTPTAITNMTKGKSKPSPQTIKSLSRYFQVNEEWLEYGTGEKEKRFEVTAVFEPEQKKADYPPVLGAIIGKCEPLSESEQIEILRILAERFPD